MSKNGSEPAIRLVPWLTVWDEIADSILCMKDGLTHGYKPPKSPTIGKLRTLDNTGTCPVCMRNVKLESKKPGVDRGCVHHGHHIRWQRFEGGCFGVGLQPWELSPSGKIKYVEALLPRLGQLDKQLNHLTTSPRELIKVHLYNTTYADSTHPMFDVKLKQEIRILESDIESIKRHITEQNKLIENWKAKDLPS